MDDELFRFRQQWQEEVSARHQQALRSSITSQPTSSAGRPNPFASRNLSHSSSTDDGVEDGPPELAAQQPPTPIAHRRISFASSSFSHAGPKSALEHYERAVEKESEGNLGESLSLYRRAFRMDHKVDSHYREKHFPRRPSMSAKKHTPLATIPSSQQSTSISAPASSSLASGSKEMSELIASFDGVQIQPIPVAKLDDSGEATDKGKGKRVETEKGVSPLATLPSELLLQIVRNIALTDIASFARLALVCKAFAYLVITEQSVWRAVCETAFSQMLWDWELDINGGPIEKPPLLESPEGQLLHAEREEERKEQRQVPIDEKEVLIYAGNWRKMFMLRPRVRFNGIYISTCNYVRAGVSQSWNTPVHIVTYYRYLRFYPNGTVLSLLSTCEPADVVHGFSKASLTPAHLGGLPVGSMSWGKYVSKGRWRMDRDGQVDVETEAPMMDKYLFRMALKVKGVRAGGRTGGINKLAWEGFWSWNMISDDLAEFSLKNDKPFFFSRVRSIEKEMGYV